MRQGKDRFLRHSLSSFSLGPPHPNSVLKAVYKRRHAVALKPISLQKNSQDYELMLWSESNYIGPQTWPMWYPAPPPETTVALIVVEVQHWGLIILSFCVFGSWEGDVAGEGLAQALSEVWEVQKDAVSRGTCRGEAPGTHSTTVQTAVPSNL